MSNINPPLPGRPPDPQLQKVAADIKAGVYDDGEPHLVFVSPGARHQGLRARLKSVVNNRSVKVYCRSVERVPELKAKYPESWHAHWIRVTDSPKPKEVKPLELGENLSLFDQATLDQENLIDSSADNSETRKGIWK